MKNVGIKRLLFILLVIGCLSFKNDKNPDSSIVIGYLYNGEVYTLDFKTGTKTQITFTGNKVEEFKFSPYSEYLAYSKFVRYVDIYKDDDTIPTRNNIYTVAVYDLNKKVNIKEFTPAGDDEFYHLSAWVKPDAVEIRTGDEFEYHYSLVYNVNAATDTVDINKTDADYGRYVYMSVLNDIKLYSDSNEFYHLTNLKNQNDVVIFKNDIAAGADTRFMALSNDKSHLLWSDAAGEYSDENNIWKRKYFRLYLRDLSKKEDALLFEVKNGDMLLFDKMSFSPDNEFISINYWEKKGIFIMNLKNKVQFKISGYDANWINTDTILFSKDNDLYTYDINSHKEEIVLENIKDPEIIIR